MQVLVTRPEPQASQWAHALQAEGIDAHALPLMSIEGPAQVEPVQTLWRELALARLVMFVSPAAAQWFFQLRPPHLRWTPGTLAAAPGPGTAHALLQAGACAGLRAEHLLHPDADAAQFDSEHLWPLLAPLDWSGQAVWIISGGNQHSPKGRAWLREQLQARGAHVTPLLTYQRLPARWKPEDQALAHAACLQPRQHTWLFSSSEAIDHLPALLAANGDNGAPWAAWRAVATHPRIAERAASAGFGEVLQARPTTDSVAQALRSAPGPSRLDTIAS